MRQSSEGVPCLTASMQDVIVVGKDAVCPEALSYPLPDLLHWIEFGRIRWQQQQSDTNSSKYIYKVTKHKALVTFMPPSVGNDGGYGKTKGGVLE